MAFNFGFFGNNSKIRNTIYFHENYFMQDCNRNNYYFAFEKNQTTITNIKICIQLIIKWMAKRLTKPSNILCFFYWSP
jgi:hypothetical protein